MKPEHTRSAPGAAGQTENTRGRELYYAICIMERLYGHRRLTRCEDRPRVQAEQLHLVLLGAPLLQLRRVAAAARRRHPGGFVRGAGSCGGSQAGPTTETLEGTMAAERELLANQHGGCASAVGRGERERDI